MLPDEAETTLLNEVRVNAAAPRVLMVGTALEGRGGVVAAVSVLREAGLFEREAVRYLPTHVDGGRLAKVARAISGACGTLSACLRDRTIIVHAHTSSRASFLRKSLVLLIARAVGCQTILHLHGGLFRQYATQESRALTRRWIRHTFERSSRVIALSSGWAQFLGEIAPRARVTVVPNAVPLPALPMISRARPGRILFLGRLEPAKGVDELLQALAILAPRFPEAHLALGGEGDGERVRRRAAELGIADRVETLGWMDGVARDAALLESTVFCLPSHAEGLPMAMLEAMAAAKPVVVTSVGGIPETIIDHDNGILVPPRAVAPLAAALAEVLGDCALREHLGQRARATIEQCYSTAIVTQQLAAIYRELEGAR